MAGDRIGIEFISLMGLPPIASVETVAALGCRHMGIGPTPIVPDPHGGSPWSLRDDASLRRDFKQALADNDVTLTIGEGFLAWPNTSIETLEPDLDLMAALGAPIANIVSIDPDLERAAAELNRFAEMAGARGMGATVEFLPGLPMADLPIALDVLRRAAHPNLKLLFDAMHLFRSGSTAADVAALDRSVIGYLQLCDVPATSPADMSYADEARFERRAPGDGDLPLRDLLRAVPRDLVVGLEVPMRGRALAGMSPRDALAPAVAATRDLLAQSAP